MSSSTCSSTAMGLQTERKPWKHDDSVQNVVLHWHFLCMLVWSVFFLFLFCISFCWCCKVLASPFFRIVHFFPFVLWCGQNKWTRNRTMRDTTCWWSALSSYSSVVTWAHILGSAGPSSERRGWGGGSPGQTLEGWTGQSDWRFLPDLNSGGRGTWRRKGGSQ